VEERRLGIGVLRYNLALFHQVRFDAQFPQQVGGRGVADASPPAEAGTAAAQAA
jgi:hypothetical protein